MKRFIPLFLLSLAFITPAQAGVMAASTRVIYQAGERDKSLMLVNTNDYPVIVQSWVDSGAGDIDAANAPFIVTPPVFRLAPQSIQGLRIMYNQEPLPADRESVFWLNLYEIPPVSKEMKESRRLTLAMNTQLKIFYRPKGLKMTLEEAVSKLTFRLQQDNGHWFIECDNPTPLNVSFTSISVSDGSAERQVESQPDMMTPPFSKKSYAITGLNSVTHKQALRFRYLDDAGEQHSVNASVSGAE